jgi:hypothetical protein
VAITELGDGTNRVDIYARMLESGPTNLFATYSSCQDVAVLSSAAFTQDGATSISSEPVVVSFSSEENRLYVMDPASGSSLLA